MERRIVLLTEEDLGQLTDAAVLFNRLQILGVYWNNGAWQFQVDREVLVQAAHMTGSKLEMQHEEKDGTAHVVADVSGIQLVAVFRPWELPAWVERR